MKIENLLKQLFDYQKFEGSKALSQIIAQADSELKDKGSSTPSIVELSIDQLDLVNAAGVNGPRPNLEALGIKKPDL